uniref:Phosphoprotein n=1 Tax=avian paramyxovirus 16 TaxID=2560322 RepID=A0A7U3XV15_9MONO|nr:phosphoprotein [Avian orthoavulavirus 16]
MATFTDEEIDELFETSGTVIENIISAQPNPVETVGRSAIPQGKTKALSLAWEKYANTPEADKREGTEKGPHASQPVPEVPTTDTPNLNNPSGSEPDAEETPVDSSEGCIRTGASSTLLSMLDKLGTKSPGTKKGSENAALTPGRSQTMHPVTIGATQLVPALEQKQVTGAIVLNPNGNRDIGGNTASSGPQKGSLPSAGVTHHAPRSDPSPGSTPVHAGSVPLPADFVQLIMTMMEAVTQKMNRIDYQLDLIVKQTASIPPLRTEIQQIKTSLAVMEANLGMMKILDPGNAHISSLSDLRAAARQHPVLLAGPGDPSPYITQSGEIAVNKLAQPVSNPTEVVKASQAPVPDLNIEKETVRALIMSRPMHPASSSRLAAKLECATTIEEVRKIKRLALNG